MTTVLLVFALLWCAAALAAGWALRMRWSRRWRDERRRVRASVFRELGAALAPENSEEDRAKRAVLALVPSENLSAGPDGGRRWLCVFPDRLLVIDPLGAATRALPKSDMEAVLLLELPQSALSVQLQPRAQHPLRGARFAIRRVDDGVRLLDGLRQMGIPVKYQRAGR